MKKIKYLPVLLAVIMILCVSIGPALAYFTAYTTAKGSATMALVPKTEITERTANESKKVVAITNNGNAPCFVRVKAFAGDDVSMSVTEGSGWSAAGTDCWAYGPVVMPGDVTSDLVIALKLPDDYKDGDTINIAVVYEATPAVWNDADGAYKPDWTSDVKVIND